MKFSVVFLWMFCSQIAGAQSAMTLERVKWLAGCWSTYDAKQQTTEVWMHPAGNAMLGMSRTISNGKMKEFEFLQITQQENGEIHYIARPSGQSEASFKLVEQTANSLKFENPEHDFPQRIIYVLLENGNSLVATIEGSQKAFDWKMKRIKCESNQ